MRRQNLHTHTVFDDGAATPMEMAQAALEAGLSSLGFSAHSTLPYDDDWYLKEDTIPAYLAAIEKTRAAFAGRLPVYNGLELDGISAQDTKDFDFIIGSLHHIVIDGQTPSIDLSAEITREALQNCFSGNQHAMIQAYFAQYPAMGQDPRVDIIGHFDLLCKFWETDGLFNPEEPFFLRCALEAMEPLVQAEKLFEVNTGAMSRGYRHEPYPCRTLLRALRDMGGRVLISTDAHAVSAISYAIADMEDLLREIGFREIWQFTGDGFQPMPL